MAGNRVAVVGIGQTHHRAARKDVSMAGLVREAAIEAQATALGSFYIDGIRHNIPFLSALMHHPRWREGNLSTGFIEEEFPRGFAVRGPEGEIARLKRLKAESGLNGFADNQVRRGGRDFFNIHAAGG